MSAWVVFAWLGFVPFVRADAPAAATTTDGTADTPHEDESLEVLREAVTAYEANDLARARVLFEQVHAQAPTARTLRSLALVAYRQERFEDAVVLFEESLASTVKPLTDAQRADVSKLLEDSRGRAHVQVPVAPDVGPPIAEPAKPVPESTPPRPAAPQEPALALTQPAAAPSSRRALRLKRGGYVLAALAGGALLTSGVALWTGLVRRDRIENICASHDDGQCAVTEVEARTHAARLDLLSKLSIAGVVTGAVLGASSATLLTLYYRAPGRGASEERVVGLTLRRTF